MKWTDPPRSRLLWRWCSPERLTWAALQCGGHRDLMASGFLLFSHWTLQGLRRLWCWPMSQNAKQRTGMAGICLNLGILVTSYVKHVYVFSSGCLGRGPFKVSLSCLLVKVSLSCLSLRSLNEKSSPLFFMSPLKFLYHCISHCPSIWNTSLC